MKQFTFECYNCGKIFTIKFKGKSSEVKICPLCKNESIQRLWRADVPGIQFNGDGFYSTDNKEKSDE